ncbi:hypothetical protein CCYA_CCYA10G2758 [Cyanidiococcus yangmingshanensis]|nr:hypothetical protein CCYA_CCYA10G2758 [Cyanidiococcus yangmingshanensis]
MLRPARIFAERKISTSPCEMFRVLELSWIPTAWLPSTRRSFEHASECVGLASQLREVRFQSRARYWRKSSADVCAPAVFVKRSCACRAVAVGRNARWIKQRGDCWIDRTLCQVQESWAPIVLSPRTVRHCSKTCFMSTGELDRTGDASHAKCRTPTEVFAIEIGLGVDLHGQDAQRAAERACQDAMQRNSYPGLRKFLPFPGDLQTMKVHVLLGVPPEFHDRIRAADIKRLFPYGQVVVQVVSGGLAASAGIHLQEHGDRPGDDRMVIVNAIITVGYDP